MTTILIEKERCECYKCSQERERKTFKSHIDSFFKNVGFTPRNFNERIKFNGKYPESSFESLDYILKIRQDINKVSDYNTEFKSTAQYKKKVAHCIDCGRLNLVSKTRKILVDRKEQPVCNICKSNSYKRCSDCGYLFPKLQTKRTADCKIICPSCFDRTYFKCARCSVIMEKDQAHYHESVSTTGLPTSIAVCHACAELVHICSQCRTLTFMTRLARENNQHMCANCFSENFGVKSYSYKPVPKLKLGTQEKKMDKYTLFTGIEWELENKSDRPNEKQISLLTEVFKPGFVYYKSDGSLSHGFEIVTHPFSWNHWRQNRELWEAAIKRVNEIKMVAQRNCGIHIHMTKSAFTSGHLYKFTKFVYDKKHRDFIIALSQRGGVNHYASFNPDDSSEKGLLHFGLKKHNDSGARHSAVNATGKTTVEVRLFQSTTDKVCFFKNVEFVFSLYDFSLNFGFKDMVLEKYINWLKQYNNNYPNLLNFLKEQKYMTTTFVKTYFKEVK